MSHMVSVSCSCIWSARVAVVLMFDTVTTSSCRAANGQFEDHFPARRLREREEQCPGIPGLLNPGVQQDWTPLYPSASPYGMA